MSQTKIAYYPGCTLKTAAKNFETSAVAVAAALGIELVELPKWNCCGTVHSLTDDNLMNHIAPVRNLLRMKQMVRDKLVTDERRMVVPCSMCYNTLKRAHLRVKENPEDLQKINDFMYLEDDDYDLNVDVIHFLDLLKDIDEKTIKEKVVRPLNGLKVVPYYGCMLLRPKEVGIDDPEDPDLQEKLLAALGAEPVDSPYRKVCCGSYLTVDNKDVVVELSYKILSHAQKSGAEAITTSCPLCAFNLDNRQKDIKEKYSDFKNMPVFYFTQLMAVAFGLSEDCYGFELHYNKPEPLLKEKQLC